jgi:hypothetical protein
MGGVEVEPRLQLGDRLLQLGDPSLQRAEALQKRGLSLGRDGVPERLRNWWVRGHPVDSAQLLYKVFDRLNGYSEIFSDCVAHSGAKRGIVGGNPLRS